MQRKDRETKEAAIRKKTGFCLYLGTPDPALNGGEDIFI